MTEASPEANMLRVIAESIRTIARNTAFLTDTSPDAKGRLHFVG